MTLWLLIMLLFPPLLSCSSVSVSSDFEQSANFSHLQTYAWMTASEEKDAGRMTDTITMSRIQTAIDRQLDLKGYQKVTESPDFLVAYHASIDEKTYYHSVPRYGGGVGFGTVGMGYQDVYQTQYEEGTLIVDIINPGTRNLLWRGLAKGIVDPHEDPATKTKQINEAVQKILKQFPP